MKIAFLMYDNMVAIDVVGPMEVFTTVAQVTKEPGYQIDYVSLNSNQVTATGGLIVQATPYLEYDISQVDTLIVPGSPKVKDIVRRSEVMDWLKSASTQVRRICSVCSGSFILAQAGLLDKKVSACHWQTATLMKKYYPKIEVDADSIYVRDGKVWSSAGGSSGIDMALALLREDYGDKAMLTVAKWLVIYAHRPGSQRQFSSLLASQVHLSDQFQSIVQWMKDNICQIDNIEAVADKWGMSIRNFHRKFVEETGETPAKYLESIRLEAAANLLQYSNSPLKLVATETGFKTDLRLIKSFQRHYQLSPSEYRKIHGLNK